MPKTLAASSLTETELSSPKTIFGAEIAETLDEELAELEELEKFEELEELDDSAVFEFALSEEEDSLELVSLL